MTSAWDSKILTIAHLKLINALVGWSYGKLRKIWSNMICGTWVHELRVSCTIEGLAIDVFGTMDWGTDATLTRLLIVEFD